ncbi:hypothetical protein LXL04_000207 [Taraxacum kok-saghyz]
MGVRAFITVVTVLDAAVLFPFHRFYSCLVQLVIIATPTISQGCKGIYQPSPDGPMGKTLAFPRGGQGFESRRVSIRGGHGLVCGSGFLDSAYYNGQRPGHPEEPFKSYLENILLKQVSETFQSIPHKTLHLKAALVQLHISNVPFLLPMHHISPDTIINKPRVTNYITFKMNLH